MQTAIVTGVTGFIGSRLTNKLLGKGWHVHAVGRGKDNISFADRVKESLKDITGIPLNKELLKKLYCYEADICKGDLGLTSPILEKIKDEKAVLFHVAGDTRFNPPDPDSLRLINISGSLNVIKFFSNTLASVVHVSTAYVAGNRTGLVLESETDKGQTFRNHYEKSKLDAELAVTELCEKLKLPLSIVRPSVIINDSVTGRSSALTHMNALFEVITRIQLHFKKLKERGHVEIRIPVSPDARPNLAPVDPMVDSLIDIGVSETAAGKTYHLCHPNPQTNNEIMTLIVEAVGLKGKINLSFADSIPEKLTWTEEMMLRSLKPYLAYLNTTCEFDLTNTRTAIPDYDTRYSNLKPGYMKKVVKFQRHRHFNVNHKKG